MSLPIDAPALRPTVRRSAGASPLRLAGPVALVAMAVLAGLFVWQTGALAPGSKVDPQELPSVAKPEQATAATATYSGVDGQNRPFAIAAKVVEQSLEDKNLVFLNTVRGDFERPTGAKLSVEAPRAQYRVNVKSLALEGGVTFVEPGRMTATMDKASVDVERQILTSESPVQVKMRGTTIEAQQLTVTENGTRIHFKGGVKARFMTKPNAKGDGG